MQTIQASGDYTSKKTGKVVPYSFEYDAFESLEEAIELLGETVVLKLVQRMTKVDASNTAREKAKSTNGDSTRPVMSEAQKAEAKQARANDKALLDQIKKLSPEQREALGL